MVAAAVVGSAVVGGVASSAASSKAAKAQTNASARATDAQREMFDVTQENLRPFIDSGTYGNKLLAQNLPNLISPINMDQATLENTPGYQFTRTQGLKAIQNSAAARGLGSSGAAYKGAADYATGLADSTYQTQFGNAVTNQTNAYNRLLSLAGLGENAAAGVGNAAVTTGQGIGNNMIGAGNAQAGSYIQGGNAIGQAAQGIPNALITNKLLPNGMYGNTAQDANYGQNYSNYANGGSAYGTN